MNEPTTKQVRNILANELGLTKEAVIAQIDHAVQRHLRGIPVESIIEKTAERVITQMVKENRHDYHSVHTIVRNVAAKQISERLVIAFKGDA